MSDSEKIFEPTEPIPAESEESVEHELEAQAEQKLEYQGELLPRSEVIKRYLQNKKGRQSEVSKPAEPEQSKPRKYLNYYDPLTVKDISAALVEFALKRLADEEDQEKLRH